MLYLLLLFIIAIFLFRKRNVERFEDEVEFPDAEVLNNCKEIKKFIKQWHNNKAATFYHIGNSSKLSPDKILQVYIDKIIPMKRYQKDAIKDAIREINSTVKNKRILPKKWRVVMSNGLEGNQPFTMCGIIFLPINTNFSNERVLNNRMLQEGIKARDNILKKKNYVEVPQWVHSILIDRIQEKLNPVQSPVIDQSRLVEIFGETVYFPFTYLDRRINREIGAKYDVMKDLIVRYTSENVLPTDKYAYDYAMRYFPIYTYR